MSNVATSVPERDEVGAEEVAALFRVVTMAVLAAVAAAIGAAYVLVSLGFATAGRGTIFVVFLATMAAAHILLREGYRRDAARAARWAFWGDAFALVAFMEGAAWGWTSFGLIAYDNFQGEVFCLLVSGGVAVASTPVFGFYRRAFLAFFVPASAPFVVTAALSRDPLQSGAAPLILIYFSAMLLFGLSFNQSFRRLIALRLHADKLAVDLKAQMEIAEAANRAKSSFLAAASHDLRQPVHALGLFVGALRSMPMSPEALGVIERIEASSQAMDDLFASLLDISRLDAGIVEVRARAFPIGPILQRIVREVVDEADAKGILVRASPSGAFLYSDPVLVERILRNLVSNAVRYTRAGRVVAGCRRRGSLVSIEVWDTGPGIPLDQREHIFQEYTQLGNVERDRTKGLGLGLAIVRRLTRLLGCELTLRSVPGRGSCFSIAIPRATERPREDRGEIAMTARAFEAWMIVVVDDEADIRTAMSMVLRNWGHVVYAAGSTAEAIERLADCMVCPDLIISDFRLRGEESGLDVIEALRREYNVRIPAILVTGDTAPERLTEARDSGHLLLHKPIANARLRAAIGNVVARGRRGEPAEDTAEDTVEDTAAEEPADDTAEGPVASEEPGAPADGRRLGAIDDL